MSKTNNNPFLIYANKKIIPATKILKYMSKYRTSFITASRKVTIPRKKNS